VRFIESKLRVEKSAACSWKENTRSSKYKNLREFRALRDTRFEKLRP